MSYVSRANGPERVKAQGFTADKIAVQGGAVSGVAMIPDGTLLMVTHYGDDSFSVGARRNLRTMSSAEWRLRPAMCFIVPSSPTSGHRTLKLRGLNHREHATTSWSEQSRVQRLASSTQLVDLHDGPVPVLV